MADSPPNNLGAGAPQNVTLPDKGERFLEPVSTTFLAIFLTVAYHLTYTAITSPKLADRLNDLPNVEQFELIRAAFDVQFDLLLAAIVLALASHGKARAVMTVTMISFSLLLLGLVCAWLGRGLKHSLDHPFIDGTAVVSFWIPNGWSVLMFLATAFVVSQKDAKNGKK